MATANETTSQTTDDECSICLVPLSQPGLDKYTTACQHQFHFQCLAKNIQAQNNECPLCRTHLSSLVNILNASANTVTVIPAENVLVQQAAPIEQAVPVQATQTQPVTTLETASQNTSAGIWNTLTHSLSSAVGWWNRTPNTSVPASAERKKTATWRVSDILKKKKKIYIISSFSSLHVLLDQKILLMKEPFVLFQIESMLLDDNLPRIVLNSLSLLPLQH